jgi:hypothetical protein
MLRGMEAVEARQRTRARPSIGRARKGYTASQMDIKQAVPAAWSD